MAASATFALKAGVWFRRGRLLMVSPDSWGTACPPSGRNSTYRPVQIFGTGSHFQCQGVPYGTFTLTWSARNKPPAAIALANDSLIVETSSRDNFGEVKITSKLDCVTIEKLVANRGNCNTNEAALPATLKFGQTLTSNYFCSKLLELNVTTDQGNALFTWSN